MWDEIQDMPGEIFDLFDRTEEALSALESLMLEWEDEVPV